VLHVDAERQTATATTLPAANRPFTDASSSAGWLRWLARDGGDEWGDVARLDWLRTRAGDDQAHRALDAAYAQHAAGYSAGRRWVAKLRTVLEATGVIDLTVAGPGVGGLWWGLSEPADSWPARDWSSLQQRLKLLVIILTVALTFVAAASVRRADLHRVLAAMGAVCLAGQLCTNSFPWQSLALGPLVLAGLFVGRPLPKPAPSPSDAAACPLRAAKPSA
jgi:hypothetical protein